MPWSAGSTPHAEQHCIHTATAKGFCNVNQKHYAQVQNDGEEWHCYSPPFQGRTPQCCPCRCPCWTTPMLSMHGLQNPAPHLAAPPVYYVVALQHALRIRRAPVRHKPKAARLAARGDPSSPRTPAPQFRILDIAERFCLRSKPEPLPKRLQVPRSQLACRRSAGSAAQARAAQLSICPGSKPSSGNRLHHA